MEYFITIAGERSGPFSQFHVIEKIREGLLKGDELAWHRGLENWKPLREVNELEGYWPLTEEKIVAAEQVRSIARTELDRPQPWMRFWARMLDYLWFRLVIGIIAASVLSPEARGWVIATAIRGVPWDSIALLLFVPLEAWMLSRFGSTPGKTLLRVQVRRLDGGLPSYSQALVRSAQVFLKGIALALHPIVQIVAMLLWRTWLVQRETTAWDDAAQTRVEHGEPELWRHVVLTGIIVFTIVITGLTIASSPEFQELMNSGSLPK